MDMNKAFVLKKEQRAPNWVVIDAKDQVVGRIATKIANMLRGKHKAHYTPQTDAGDYVVVINADKVKFTGKKWNLKEYQFYSLWIGGLKTVTADEMLQKHPTRVLELAVKRMLPRSKMGRAMFGKLRLYAGEQHPHQAQVR
jgi:large subunit ribosomal protein L13